MTPKDQINLLLTQKLPIPIAELIGLNLLSCADGQCKFELDVSKKHHNPLGTIHGGVLCDIADAAMGIAFFSTLNDNESFTTINLQINFFKPIIEGKIIATAKSIYRGRSIGYIECDILDNNGILIAKATSTCKVLTSK